MDEVDSSDINANPETIQPSFHKFSALTSLDQTCSTRNYSKSIPPQCIPSHIDRKRSVQSLLSPQISDDVFLAEDSSNPPAYEILDNRLDLEPYKNASSTDPSQSALKAYGSIGNLDSESPGVIFLKSYAVGSFRVSIDSDIVEEEEDVSDISHVSPVSRLARPLRFCNRANERIQSFDRLEEEMSAECKAAEEMGNSVDGEDVGSSTDTRESAKSLTNNSSKSSESPQTMTSRRTASPLDNTRTLRMHSECEPSRGRTPPDSKSIPKSTSDHQLCPKTQNPDDRCGGGNLKFQSGEKLVQLKSAAKRGASPRPSGGGATPPATKTPAPQSSPQDLRRTLSTVSPIFRACIAKLKFPMAQERRRALTDLLGLLDEAWAEPVTGKELANALCDILRCEGGVDALLSICDEDEGSGRGVGAGGLVGGAGGAERGAEGAGEGAGGTGEGVVEAMGAEERRGIQRLAAKVLSRSMVVANREYVARTRCEAVVRFTQRLHDDLDFSRSTTKVIECLFKDSKATCSELIRLGALDEVLHFCREPDTRVLRNCAGALANLALFGGRENQREMVARRVQLWLFPLAFSNDDSIRYYALLAIAALSANKELERAVVDSGTLQLVAPFLRGRDPETFGRADAEHVHGQSDEWVMRLAPLLRSGREETLGLAAFHYAMEAGIRQRKGDVSLFKTAQVLKLLRRLAASPYSLAARFSCQALRLVGEQVPRRLSSQVSLWTSDDVSCWLHQLGLGEPVIKRFEECQVDGDLLLLLTDEHLRDDIRMTNGITRKRFLRELDELRQMCDYAPIDPSRLTSFLRAAHPDLCRYAYPMLRARVTTPLLPLLTDELLLRDCGVTNGVHRLLISRAAKALPSSPSSISSPTQEGAIAGGGEGGKAKDDFDAFISYRRASGSLLASLLKVYLEIRGLRVFLDIDGMLAGKFDENLLKTIDRSRTFLLVLSPNTLDRCVGDTEGKDWVHRELSAAIASQCKIIPVIQEGFVFPPADQLPPDISCIEKYQAILWNSGFHDACIDKLVRYMRDEEPATLVHPLISKSISQRDSTK